jgi:hypothetical protein
MKRVSSDDEILIGTGEETPEIDGECFSNGYAPNVFTEDQVFGGQLYEMFPPDEGYSSKVVGHNHHSMVRVTIGMVISLGNNERWRFPTIFFER